jgi:hypothetical protein
MSLIRKKKQCFIIKALKMLRKRESSFVFTAVNLKKHSPKKKNSKMKQSLTVELILLGR